MIALIIFSALAVFLAALAVYIPARLIGAMIERMIKDSSQ